MKDKWQTLSELFELASCYEDRGYKTPCRIWLRATNKDGYGKLRYQNEDWLVHRLAWYDHYEDEPYGQLDHLCHVRNCFELSHLEDVPGGVNFRRNNHPYVVLMREGKCKAGHTLAETGYYLLANGHKRCAVCRRKWSKESRLRNK